jgi:dTDP-4-dehydrorhamnose 3,5-epimerase
MKFEVFEFGATWLVKSEIHQDIRGSFRETFRRDLFYDYSQLDFNPVQINSSLSKKGVLRGIHYSVSDAGQAKWISCLQGEIEDYVIDLRLGSPTFGEWKSITLSANNGLSLIIPTGFGHAFEARSDDCLVSYALTSSYDPETEMTISPHDPTIRVNWVHSTPEISDRDKFAPTLSQQVSNGNIPSDNLAL